MSELILVQTSRYARSLSRVLEPRADVTPESGPRPGSKRPQLQRPGYDKQLTLKNTFFPLQSL